MNNDRHHSYVQTLVVAAIALTFAACQSQSPSVPTPPAPTPTPTTISGVWNGEQTVVSLTGGECLGAPLQEIVGFPSQFHATIEQTGSRATATLDIDHLGAVCSYEGTIDGDALELHATSCTASKQIGLRCPGGEQRDILQSSTTLRATIASDRISGMAIENDTVVESGTTRTVAPLTFTSAATLLRQ